MTGASIRLRRQDLAVLRGQCLLKQQNGDDYPAAALKRLQDADLLIKGRRFDSLSVRYIE